MSTTAFGGNTFIPTLNVGIQVGFHRNVKDFKLNQYSKIVKTDKTVGHYVKMDSKSAGRILEATSKDREWVDGADFPVHKDTLDPHDFVGYRTRRLADSFVVGELAAEQADFKLVAHNASQTAQRMMIVRTLDALSALSAADWASVGNVMGVNGNSEVTTGSAQGVNNGTPENPIIKKLFQAAFKRIQKVTLNGVRPEDLLFVCGPDIASAMANSPEVHAIMKESQYALPLIQGKGSVSPIGRYGLPPVLYGMKIVVEDTAYHTDAKGSSTYTPLYALGSGSAYFLSRPGGLDGLEGASSWSTLTGFFKEEMTVRVKNDPDNRRILGSIVSNYVYQVTEVKAGVRVTDLLSTDSSGV